MPGDDRLRFHDEEDLPPTGPCLMQDRPEQPIQCSYGRSGPAPFQDGYLLAKRQHFESNVPTVAEEDPDGGKECGKK